MEADNNGSVRYIKANILAEDLTMSWSCLGGTEGRLRPEALVSLPGGKVIISDSGNKCLKMFTINGDFIGFFAHKGVGAVTQPYSLTAFSDGTVAVFDAGDKSIKLFSMAGRFIKTVKDDNMDSPLPLGSSKEGEVVYPLKQSIRFTSIRTFKSHDLPVNTTKILIDAKDIVVSQNHVICCGMTGNDVMFINRKSGEVVLSEDCLNNPTIEPGLKPMFYGMCLDKNENLYISDCDNNRIVFIQKPPTELIITFDCEEWVDHIVKSYTYSHLNSVLLCPKHIYIGAEGELVVIEHLGKIKSFNIKNKDAVAVRHPPKTETDDDLLLFSAYTDISEVETVQSIHYKCC